MVSLFTRIVQGEIPCYKVAETESCLAFLDINPLKKGHTLCIPKVEVDYIFDLDPDQYTDLMLFTKRVAKAIDQVITSERVGVAIIGFEVPHAHVHLVPLDGIRDIDFSLPRLKFTTVEFLEIAHQISAHFKS
ncbi:MAG TPA: HIT family protein [Saprospiraceae bacterium]|nr:HIT family protein [Saprospiraceae bacterium]